MKIKLILLIALICAFTSINFGQTVKITGKKVTFKRTIKEPDFKKTFTLNYPKVAGVTGKKIEAILDYEKHFEFKIAEEQKETTWLDSADYEVKYNKSNILQIDLSIEGSAAYPSGSTKRFIINSKTGTRVKPSDVFTNLSGLAALGEKSLKAEMKKARADYKKDADSADFDPSEYFDNAKFTTENLWAFTVADKGLTFHYDYGFPHAVLALQPDGEYSFSWAELKPFIKKDGLFGVFIK